ncbi:MAG: hypothetical protein BWY52_02399 [Chloroflexi bacterium ADurb.Bin325]|nr:MAG: hypothetical protein BWY52_02399 [Chloroflexi bacterium ADurb.Bin325]
MSRGANAPGSALSRLMAPIAPAPTSSGRTSSLRMAWGTLRGAL